MKGWGFWRALPLFSGVNWRGQFYFIDLNGTVWRMFDGPDNVLLDDPDGSQSRNVDFSLLSAYQNLEEGRYGIGGLVRPTFVGPSGLNYDAKLLYDFNLTELNQVGDVRVPQASLWAESGNSDPNDGIWDESVWTEDQNVTTKILGASGIGRNIAVALRGTALRQTTLIETDVSAKLGGFL